MSGTQHTYVFDHQQQLAALEFLNLREINVLIRRGIDLHVRFYSKYRMLSTSNPFETFTRSTSNCAHLKYIFK